MKNINSACNVVSLQSQKTAPETVRDSDLIINLSSDAPNCDNSESDIDKTYLPSQYNFEQDIEKLIKVSKQFQTDYENEKIQCLSGGVADDPDNYLNIQILTSNSNSIRRQKAPAPEVNLQRNDVDNYYFSNCSSRKENVCSLRSSQRNKIFTPKLPSAGPFGTGIIRPSPKKHSCVKKGNEISIKQSYRLGWNVRPYTARYYNFNRTHPKLKLVENGDSIIPKRIPKETTEMTGKAKSESETKKPLLNRGLTWHEFFERSNVYSAKSVQSSYGDVQTNTTSTQADMSEPTPRSNGTNRIQKHILPQLNIRAECSVQRIPEISIAPNGLRNTVQSNIKLVEIVYEDAETKLQRAEAPIKRAEDSFKEDKTIMIEGAEFLDDLECTSSLDLVSTEVNENTKLSESKISLTRTSKTSSENNGYDSSLDESISLNVSRVSELEDHETLKNPIKDAGVQTRKLIFTSALTDHDTIEKPIRYSSAQTQKLKRFAKHRKDITDRKAIKSSSDFSEFEYDDKHPPQPQEVKLPTFPTNELIQMVDEIFDTSSDAANMSYKYLVKETSVQTDIVWENINDLFKQQTATTKEAIAVESQFTQISAKPQTTVTLPSNFEDRHFMPPESYYSNVHAVLHEDIPLGGYCRHTHLRKFKICSCVACKSNIRFSAVNINQSSSGSSSAAIDSPIPIPIAGAKVKLFPSERYKQMKQAQREHFQNDPRISKTLKKIYETAKTIKSRNERTSSSSSGHHSHLNNPLHLNNFPSCDDDILQPDLYTFSDEMLLFGFDSSPSLRGNQYSSHLLKTESSQDTFASNDRYCGMDTSNEMFLRNKLMCTNSEESSGNSLPNKRSDLELCLMRDIENSGSDPVLSLVSSTSSLERKVNEIQLHDQNSAPEIT